MNGAAQKRFLGALVILLTGATPACMLYDSSLLDGEGSGGDTSSGGGEGSTGGTTASGGDNQGGATGSGGSESSGGGCSWGRITEPPETLSVFDHFDDNDKNVLEVEGRSGRWNSDNDQSGGHQSPSGFAWESFPMQEREDEPGNFALHYVATGFQVWHLVMAEIAAGSAYDLSAYDGVVLWVRTDCEPVTGFQAQLRVAISDAESFDSSGAIDHAGWAVPFTLTTEWRRVKIPFSSMRRRFGSTTLLDRTTARALVVSANAPGDLDVWIDEIAFYDE